MGAVYQRGAILLGILISLLALYRQLKTPRFDKEYGQKIFQNEFTHNLFYTLMFFAFPGKLSIFNLLFTLPLTMHFVVGLAEYTNLRQGRVYSLLRG